MVSGYVHNVRRSKWLHILQNDRSHACNRCRCYMWSCVSQLEIYDLEGEEENTEPEHGSNFLVSSVISQHSRKTAEWSRMRSRYVGANGKVIEAAETFKKKKKKVYLDQNTQVVSTSTTKMHIFIRSFWGTFTVLIAMVTQQCVCVCVCVCPLTDSLMQSAHVRISL